MIVIKGERPIRTILSGIAIPRWLVEIQIICALRAVCCEILAGQAASVADLAFVFEISGILEEEVVVLALSGAPVHDPGDRWLVREW